MASHERVHSRRNNAKVANVSDAFVGQIAAQMAQQTFPVNHNVTYQTRANAQNHVQQARQDAIRAAMNMPDVQSPSEQYVNAVTEALKHQDNPFARPPPVSQQQQFQQHPMQHAHMQYIQTEQSQLNEGARRVIERQQQLQRQRLQQEQQRQQQEQQKRQREREEQERQQQQQQEQLRLRQQHEESIRKQKDFLQQQQQLKQHQLRQQQEIIRREQLKQEQQEQLKQEQLKQEQLKRQRIEEQLKQEELREREQRLQKQREKEQFRQQQIQAEQQLLQQHTHHNTQPEMPDKRQLQEEPAELETPSLQIPTMADAQHATDLQKPSTQAQSLSLLNYLHSTAPQFDHTSRPFIAPTPRTPDIMIDVSKPCDLEQSQLTRVNSAMEREAEEVDEDDEDDMVSEEVRENGEFVESPSTMYVPPDKNAFQILPSPDPIVQPRDRRLASMDVSLAFSLSNLGSGILKLQSEGVDMQSLRRLSMSNSCSLSANKLSSGDWAASDTNDLGQLYFNRDPGSNLNRLSGSVKYTNGKWSANLSDVFGGKNGSTGSNGLLSLMIPEFGARGSYSNSISPLGMTIATPGASPRTAFAYNHRGFTSSPHQSFSFDMG